MAKPADDQREIARLYALPLDEFVGERDAAAKRLRESGDAEAAKRLKALPKPNLPAAAINRAVAADPPGAKAVIKASERLEAAQGEVLAGGDADALRKAAADHGEAVERLMETVTKELAGAGGASALDRARETLRAAAADADLRATLASGTLARDREGVGFGAAAATAPAPTKRRKIEPKAAKGKPKPRGASAADRKRAEQAVSRAERSLKAGTDRLKQAERRLERARRGLAEAEEEVADADRERAELEAGLAEARGALPG